jgi:hypothetical protein
LNTATLYSLAGFHKRVTLSSSTPATELPMSMQSHLVELEKRHQAIEKEIETELHSPASSDLKIVELKRKKLLLKDEIRKLQSAPAGTRLH